MQYPFSQTKSISEINFRNDYKKKEGGVIFEGVKVFSATKARDREGLGGNVTRWLRGNPDCEVIDKIVTQSSDAEFHCLTITLFYKEKPSATA